MWGLKKKAKPTTRSVSKLGVCLTFLRIHRDKSNVYCVVANKGEAEFLRKEFPNVKFLTLSAATTGWSDLDPNAYLCCTRMLDHVRSVQMAHRIRYPHRENQVLVYDYTDKPVPHFKFKEF